MMVVMEDVDDGWWWGMLMMVVMEDVDDRGW